MDTAIRNMPRTERLRRASILRRRSSVASFVESIKSGHLFRRKSSFSSAFPSEGDGQIAIQEVRDLLQEKIDAKPELYDARDVIKLREDALIKCYLKLKMTTKDISREAALALDEYLMWRKSRKVNDIKISDVPREFYEWGLINMSEDDSGIKLIFNMKLWQKCPEWTDALVDWFLYHFEDIIKRQGYESGKKADGICDCLGMPVMEADLSLCFKFIDVIMKYPDFVRSSYFVDVHWMLKPLISTCLKVLPTRYSSIIQNTDRKGLLKILPEEDLPQSLGGVRKFTLDAPAGCSTLEEIAKKNGISKTGLKKLQDHIESCKRKAAS